MVVATGNGVLVLGWGIMGVRMSRMVMVHRLRRGMEVDVMTMGGHLQQIDHGQENQGSRKNRTRNGVHGSFHGRGKIRTTAFFGNPCMVDGLIRFPCG